MRPTNHYGYIKAIKIEEKDRKEITRRRMETPDSKILSGPREITSVSSYGVGGWEGAGRGGGEAVTKGGEGRGRGKDENNNQQPYMPGLLF